ncbi:MAG: J domain-containing protein [Acutalibacteraceae bacterium]
MEKDSYEILGVSPNATDEEVKQAYRQLAKKYHPDRYVDSPLAETAAEKMKEINDAYDRILDERKKARESGADYQTYHTANTRFSSIRQLINANRFAEAEEALNACPSESRNAEWYYLKGFILYRRGWLEEAYNHFKTACEKEPQNAEYQAAFDRITKQRNGAYGGYAETYSSSGCTVCDVCQALICMDCCCDCCMR